MFVNYFAHRIVVEMMEMVIDEKWKKQIYLYKWILC